MSQKLFLSYKRDDNKDGFVEKLYNALIDNGFDVWWDMQSMPHRQLTFLQNIRDAIAERDRVVLVGSNLAYESEYVKAEFEYALSVCKPVHTIMRNDAYNDIPSELRDKDVPDFKDDAKFEASFEHLLRHLQDDIAPLGTIHGSRPALPAWYIERDNIMDELENKVLIDSKQPVVVTSKQQVSALHGMGGIGKTTVANAFSERCATRRYFPDGIFWIQPGKTPDITFQQANIGKIFGDDPKEYLSPEKGLARLQALLSDKRILFVLDDVWEREHADAFRIQGDFTRTLITTRQQDLVTQIAAMSAEVDKLTVEEGLRLFDARLVDEEGNPRQPENRKHEDIERQIIELLDGYTLAVELASAQLFKKGEDYAERLLERLQKKRETDNPFSDLEIEGDGKNDNLEISLAISYEDLTDDEQRRFRVLGVLAPNAPFSYELMQPLYGDDDDSITEDKLDVIQNMALLQFGKTGNYLQHNLLREYAKALLKRQSEFNIYHIFYLEHITKLAHPINLLPPEEWYELENNIPHILYVGDTLVATYRVQEELKELANEFAQNTSSYVYSRPEACRVKWLEMGLAIAESANDSKGQAIFLNDIALVYEAIGEKNDALDIFKRALHLRRKIGDKGGEAVTLTNLGLVHDHLGDKEQALDYLRQSLTINREIGYEKGEAVTLNNIGSVYNSLGNKEQALGYYHQVLPLCREVGDKHVEAATLNNIGQVHASLGNKEQALDFYHQALYLRREVRDKWGEADTLNNIGIAYRTTSRNQQALDYYHQALSICRETSNQIGEANALTNIGKVYDVLGEKEQALNYYNQAFPIFQEVGDKEAVAQLLGNIGLTLCELSENELALYFLNQALAICQEVGNPTIEAITLANVGFVFSNWGDKQQALVFYNQALPILRQIGDTFAQFDLLGNIAMIFYQHGDLDEAINYLSQCVTLGEKIGNPSTEEYRTHLLRFQQERDGEV